ncbi:uncharacterized protein [Macrobrachium rosenbergii]|uniref:uncharacterized protein n=1 Tax=Macrobrachium rosenbergii TaxID=79674 RepID=UPI0034D511A2
MELRSHHMSLLERGSELALFKLRRLQQFQVPCLRTVRPAKTEEPAARPLQMRSEASLSPAFEKQVAFGVGRGQPAITASMSKGQQGGYACHYKAQDPRNKRSKSDKGIIEDDDEDVDELRSLTGAYATPGIDPEIEKLRLQIQLQQEQQKSQQEQQKLQREQQKLQQEQQKTVALEAAQELQKQRELLALEYEHKCKLAELEIQKEQQSANIQINLKTDESSKFDILKAKKLLPDFDEKDPEVFFTTFEDTAKTLKWPQEQWVMVVRNQFKGKAAYVISQMVNVKEYDVIKKAVLDAYAITAEGYRQQFRHSYKMPSQTFVEFCNDKVRQFTKWLQKTGVSDFESLKNLILMEEFIRKLPSNIATFILEKGETNLLKAGSLADDYYLIHKTFKPFNKSTFSPSSTAYCSYCKQEGHHIENCPNPSCKKSDVGKNSPNPNRKDNKKTFHVAAQEFDGDVFKPFTCKGTVNGIPVTCLQDTGFSQTVVALPSQDFKLRLLIGNDLAGAIVNPVVSDPDILIENESNKLNNAVIQMTSIKPIVIDDGNRVEKTLDLINMTKSNFKDLQNKDPVLKALWKKVADPDDHPKTPYFYLDKDLLFRHFRSSKAPATTTWFDCHQLVVPLSLVPALLDLAHSHVNHFGVNKTYSTLTDDFFWPGMKKDIQQFIKACHHCQTTGKPNERLPPAPLQPISVPKFPFERIIIDCVGPMPRTKQGIPSPQEKLLTQLLSRFHDVCSDNLQRSQTIQHDIVIEPGATPIRQTYYRMVGKKLDSLKQEVMPFGLTNAPATFQRMMSEVIRNMKDTYVYMDDVVVASDDWDEHLQTLELFHRFRASKVVYENKSVPIVINPDVEVAVVTRAKAKAVDAAESTVDVDLSSLGRSDVAVDSSSVRLNPIGLLKNLFRLRKKEFGSLLIDSGEITNVTVPMFKKDCDTDFDVGQKVLVLLPIPGNSLKATFQGPWKVLKKVNNVNFLVETPDRRKPHQLVHINMMKTFHEREKVRPIAALQDCRSDFVSNNAFSDEPNNDCFSEDRDVYLKDSEWLAGNVEALENLPQMLSHLGKDEQQSLRNLVLKYRDLFSNVPGKTTILQHDVDVGDATPVKQAPYRLNPKKNEIVAREVEYMLKHNLIEPSCSPWSSPVVLVKKSDGDYRLCFDYRKRNEVTKADSFPLPRVEDCIDRMGRAKYIRKFDLLKGDDWQSHLKRIEALFKVLRKAGLVINLRKSDFAKATVVYLGHEIGADITDPLTALLKKNVTFIWSKEAQEALEKIKLILISRPLLAAPNFDSPFQLTTDASDVGVGAVCPLKFADHNPLTFLNRYKNKNQRLMRWSILVQEFNLQFKHIPGKENMVADALSWLAECCGLGIFMDNPRLDSYVLGNGIYYISWQSVTFSKYQVDMNGVMEQRSPIVSQMAKARCFSQPVVPEAAAARRPGRTEGNLIPSNHISVMP